MKWPAFFSTHEYPLILEFHDIHPSRRMGINTLHPDDFEQLIRSLKKHFTIGSFKNFSSGEIVLSFDDAYESVYQYAFPILDHYSISAGIFVITNFLGRTNDWDPSPLNKRIHHIRTSQLRHLIKKNWIPVPHGHNHIAYRAWNLKFVLNDFKSSIRWYTRFMGGMPVFFGLPFNQIDYSVWYSLQERYSSLPLFLGGIHGNCLSIPRFPVYSFMKTDWILKQVEQWPHLSIATRKLLTSIQWGAKLSGYWQRFILDFPRN
jgi:peptidoglycan/xylan/chitin deacetylase (PgdA/CDA1 family)